MGFYIRQSDQLAYEWVSKAAESVYPPLPWRPWVKCCWQGWGLISKANPSSDQKYHRLVEKHMAELEKKLSPEQIRITQDNAAKWQPDHWQPPEDLFEG